MSRTAKQTLPLSLLLLLLCLAVSVTGFRPAGTVSARVTTLRSLRSLSMKQIRVVKPAYTMQLPQKTMADFYPDKDKASNSSANSTSATDTQTETETPRAPRSKPMPLNEALRLMQKQWKTIGVGAAVPLVSSTVAVREASALSLSLPLSLPLPQYVRGLWAAPPPAPPVVVAAAAATPLNALTQDSPVASAIMRILEGHGAKVWLGVGLCVVALSVAYLNGRLPFLSLSPSLSLSLSSSSSAARLKKKAKAVSSAPKASVNGKNASKEAFDPADFQRYVEREERRKASITRREVDEMQDPAGMSFYDLVEETHIAREEKPLKRRLMRKRRQWRVQNDASLTSERADYLFGDDNDNDNEQPDEYANDEEEEEETQDIEQAQVSEKGGLEDPVSPAPHADSTELDKDRDSTQPTHTQTQTQTHTQTQAQAQQRRKAVFAKIVAAPAESQLSPPLSVSVSPHGSEREAEGETPTEREPAATSKSGSGSGSGSLWSKLSSSLFSRSPIGRPVDLTHALALSTAETLSSDAEREAQREFKEHVADVLVRALPLSVERESVSELFRESESESASSERETERDVNALSSSLSQALSDCMREDRGSLSLTNAAEGFADVANVFAVRLIDRAVATHDKGEKEPVVAALDALSLFVERVESLYESLFPPSLPPVAPIVYNGNAKKQKIEKIFEEYLRGAAQNPLMGMFPPSAMPSGGEGEEVFVSPAVRAGRVDRLQTLLGVSEQRRTALETKLRREGMWSLAKSVVGGQLQNVNGGKGVLASIGKAISGNKAAPQGLGGALGGPMGMPDLSALQQMLGGAGGAGGLPMPDMAAMQQMFGGQGMPDMKDLDKMWGSAGAGGLPDMAAMQKMFGGAGIGNGGLPDMAALQSLFGGDGANMPDMAQLQSMLGGQGGADMQALQQMFQQAGLSEEELMKDPERMRSVTRDSFRSLRDAVDQGAVQKADVEEFERMMGIDVDVFLQAISQQRVDTGKLRETLGADEEEAKALFQQLAKIKRG